MTIPEFQSDKERMGWLRSVLEHPNMLAVLSVMNESRPEKRPVASDITPTTANIRLGMGTGWAEYEATLLQLAVYPADNEPLTPDYGTGDAET